MFKLLVGSETRSGPVIQNEQSGTVPYQKVVCSRPQFSGVTLPPPASEEHPTFLKFQISSVFLRPYLKNATLLTVQNRFPGCSLKKRCHLLLQACDAKSGIGLQEGLDWLSRQLVAAGLQDLG